MKTMDISDTWLVRKYGPPGAKLFARFWFSLLYVVLIALTAAFWVVAPQVAPGWRQIILGCLSGALIVLATSLLTRMRLQYLAAIERLDRAKAA